MANKELVDFLLKQCKERNLSLRSLSINSGLSPATVYNIINRQYKPSLFSLNQLASYLGVKSEYLWQLAGLLQGTDSRDESTYNDRRLRARFAQADKLPDSARNLIVGIVDAAIVNLKTDKRTALLEKPVGGKMPAPKGILERWKESVAAKIASWLPRSEAGIGIRSRHFWIITALMAFSAFLYYVAQTPLVNIPPFDNSFFTGVHDLNRTIFLVPAVYAALVFRVPGVIIVSLVFLCVVLPRAMLFSPYPNALIRPIFFVAVTTLASPVIASQLNRFQRKEERV